MLDYLAKSQYNLMFSIIFQTLCVCSSTNLTNSRQRFTSNIQSFGPVPARADTLEPPGLKNDRPLCWSLHIPAGGPPPQTHPYTGICRSLTCCHAEWAKSFTENQANTETRSACLLVPVAPFHRKLKIFLSLSVRLEGILRH